MGALEVRCPRCGAGPGVRCETKTGTPCNPHTGRIDAAQLAETAAPPPLDIGYTKLPPKLRYRVRLKHYVWCDRHSVIHDRTTDPYGYGEDDCEVREWRRIWTESGDKTETF